MSAARGAPPPTHPVTWCLIWRHTPDAFPVVATPPPFNPKPSPRPSPLHGDRERLRAQGSTEGGMLHPALEATLRTLSRRCSRTAPPKFCRVARASTMATLPGGLTLQDIREELTTILNAESWDTLTPKIILAKLEASKLPTHAPGTLKPFKGMVKELLKVFVRERAESGNRGAAAKQVSWRRWPRTS